MTQRYFPIVYKKNCSFCLILHLFSFVLSWKNIFRFTLFRFESDGTVAFVDISDVDCFDKKKLCIVCWSGNFRLSGAGWERLTQWPRQYCSFHISYLLYISPLISLSVLLLVSHISPSYFFLTSNLTSLSHLIDCWCRITGCPKDSVGSARDLNIPIFYIPTCSNIRWFCFLVGFSFIL